MSVQNSNITATLAFAMAFLFLVSCGEHSFDDIFGLSSSSAEEEDGSGSASGGRNSGGDSGSPSSIYSSSSSSVYSGSSSSVSGGMSSSGTAEQNIAYGAPVEYEGETYQTVIIGSQTWFAKNLNYAADRSVCYNNLESNCDEYGKLYDWPTAMKLPINCNASACSSQVTVPHRGICPAGWHVPSDAEWSILINYADGTGGDALRDSPTAGRYLKAQSGWNSRGGISGNGEDKYGFAALPGGSRDDAALVFGMPDFVGAGSYGYWWSATEYTFAYAYDRYMTYGEDAAYYGTYYKPHYRSIRCVKDSPSGANASSSSTARSSSSVWASSGSVINYDASVEYEGEIYQTVIIGSQTWFARNLKYAVDGSKCAAYTNSRSPLVDENTEVCDEYGRLYNWLTAMKLPSECRSKSCADQINEKHQGICPSGWHIPSDNDWSILINYIDGTGGSWRRESPRAGRYLKATSGWNNFNGESGNGEDVYGFAALPSGSYSSVFTGIGFDVHWLSATEVLNATDQLIHGRAIYYHGTEVTLTRNYKSSSFTSVRCIKD